MFIINACTTWPGWAIVWLQDLLDFCDEFERLLMYTRQSNLHGWEPCSSVYYFRPVQRHVIKFLRVLHFVALVLIRWALYCISLAFRYRVPACSTSLSRCLEKISTDRGHNCTLLFRCLSHLQKSFLFFPRPLALRMNFILFVGWTIMTHLM